MNPEQKQKLIELGADRLADALLELAGRDDTADDLLERMKQADFPLRNIL